MAARAPLGGTPTDAAQMVGLPPGTTLLELGQWLLEQDPEAVAAMAVEGGLEMLQTLEAAVELARKSTAAVGYLRDPVGWVDRHVSFPPGRALVPYQADAMAELAEQGRLALRGPHGLGKTALASLTVLWFAITRDGAGIQWKVPTLASVGRQLERYLWPEIHLWAARIRWDLLGRPPFGPHELLTLRLRLAYGEAWAMSASDPTAIEGAHATHLLFIYDEAKAIADAFWNASEGAFASAGGDTEGEAWALALSTPGAPQGRFFQIHTRAPGTEDWRARHVRLADTIAAGRVSADWALQRARQWGPRSAVFIQRVLGEFATSETNAVIPLEWVEAANERWWALVEASANAGPVVAMGVDVAREGNDQTCIAHSCAAVVLEPVLPGVLLTGALVARVRVESAKFPGRPAIVVDADGIGAGVFDGVRAHVDYQDRTYPFHAASSANWTDATGELEFGNLRAAAWWALRDELNPDIPEHVPSLALPPNDLLTGDLTAPTFEERAAGRIYIESKDDIRKRLGRSTDVGDAVVMARWGRVMATRAIVTAADHRPRPGSPPMADLRRGPEVAGPNMGQWSPGRVGF